MSMPTTPSETRPPRLRGAVRLVLPLILLVLVVGGIAWVGQNLHRWRDPVRMNDPNAQAPEKPPLAFFTPPIALWEKPREPKPERKPDKKSKKTEDPMALYPSKEFEPQTKGHYDFLFKNTSGKDVEIALKQTGCDCAGVVACVLPAADWERVLKMQQEKPGETFPFPEETAWHELSFDAKKKPLPVKPDECGIVRATWTARKPAGQKLVLRPAVWVQAGGERMEYSFLIPGVMSLPVRVYPTRLPIHILKAGAIAMVEFDVWSPTRDTLNVKMAGPGADPLVVIDAKPLSKEACAKLETDWREDKKFLLANQNMPTRVRAAYHVTVTVFENKDGKQLPQGGFYRQLPIVLDDIVGNADLHGPELVGRVEGDITIGGADDQGRIRFKAFDSKVTTSKEVDLAADGNAVLEPYDQNPATLEVKVTRDVKNSTKERSRWKLKVTVPAHSFAGSFTDAHAVTLRIEGEPMRLVRIPIEGNVGGR